MLVISSDVVKWRHYLLGRKFFIHTEHLSLQNLTSQTIQTHEKQQWLCKLLGNNYEIIYKPGGENKVSKALSRYEYKAISQPEFEITKTLQQFWSTPTSKTLYNELTSKVKNSKYFIFNNEILHYGDRLFIPPETESQWPIIHEFYDTRIEGHSGVECTLACISANFYWPQVRHSVQKYVDMRVVCQQMKYISPRLYRVCCKL